MFVSAMRPVGTKLYFCGGQIVATKLSARSWKIEVLGDHVSTTNRGAKGVLAARDFWAKRLFR